MTLGPHVTFGPDHWLVKGSTGRGVSVAVVDSGINPWHPHVRGISGGTGFASDASPLADHADELGHGTAVAAAIRERAPDAELTAVRVFVDRLATSGSTLAAAIEWCAQREVKLINLSLGTSNPDHGERLGRAVQQATTAGCLVISVAPEGQVDWLPGALPQVVAVKPDETLGRHEVAVVGDPGRLTFRASPVPRPVPGVPPEFNLSGPSFAVANTTGFLACLLESVPEIRDWTALNKTLLGGA